MSPDLARRSTRGLTGSAYLPGKGSSVLGQIYVGSCDVNVRENARSDFAEPSLALIDVRIKSYLKSLVLICCKALIFIII